MRAGSDYIGWAKSRERFRYNIGRSSIRPCPPEQLAIEAGELALNGPNAHGWPPLLAALAARYGASSDRIVLAVGCSMANHLAAAALIERGAHVLVESPGYEPLSALPAWLGARVESFERGPGADGFRADAVAERLRPETRLVILSDPHNPTGHRASGVELERLGQLAESHDLHVLVDEVYCEFDYSPGDTIAAHRGDRWISTCSLTKAYGLDGLRAGWLICGTALAARVRALNDLFGIIMPHPSERLALRALERIDTLRSGVARLLAGNRAIVERFIAERDELSWQPPPAGPVGFVRLDGVTVDHLLRELETRHDATLTPGAFFGAPDHFRIGWGMIPADLEGGLQRLGTALDSIHHPRR